MLLQRSPSIALVALLLGLVLAPASARPVDLSQEPAEGSDAAADADAADVPTRGVTSLLVRPLYLAARPPDARSAQNLHLVTADAEGAPEGSPTRAEALALALELARRARAGEDFAALAAWHSAAANARSGAVLGTFPRGLLQPEMDDFLFAAEIGEVSDPIENELGVHLLRRVERWAAVRQILIAGEPEERRARAEAVEERLAAGEDFRDLARELSDDEASAARGGDYQIFERGPHDKLLKAAAFQVPVGGIVGPIETPLGLHFLQRVPVEELDPALAEPVFVRARAILVAQGRTPEEVADGARDPITAAEIARALHERIAAGEDMAALAREANDDPTGRERAGDLGWIHRGHPGAAAYLRRLWPLEDGRLLDLVRTEGGFAIVRKEAAASGLRP